MRCEHSREDYRTCPHCMGIGSASAKPVPQSWEQMRNSAAEEECLEFNGCFTGDCPHDLAKGCGLHFYKAGADFGHEWTLQLRDDMRDDLLEQIERLVWQNVELKFELEAKQKPLSEQVLALTLERDGLRRQVDSLVENPETKVLQGDY